MKMKQRVGSTVRGREKFHPPKNQHQWKRVGGMMRWGGCIMYEEGKRNVFRWSEEEAKWWLFASRRRQAGWGFEFYASFQSWKRAGDWDEMWMAAEIDCDRLFSGKQKTRMLYSVVFLPAHNFFWEGGKVENTSASRRKKFLMFQPKGNLEWVVRVPS